MSKNLKRFQILTINELIKLKLNIPNYQRPYTWKPRSINMLLRDIEEEAKISTEIAKPIKYRLGTIILNKDGDHYDIVDGQQRIISLILIKLCLNDSVNSDLINKGVDNRESQLTIYNNYNIIKDYFSSKSEAFKELIKELFATTFEVVVLVVDEISEAFQLFDSQNTRGKELYPQDLLKAYHLRLISNTESNEIEKVVNKWESYEPKEIRDLMGVYMFPILNWSSKNKTMPFTNDKIDNYKGVDASWNYPYTKLITKYTSHFQLSEPFESGKNFFDMIAYYLETYNYVIKNTYEKLFNILSKVDPNVKERFKEFSNKSIGFKYAKQVFDCAMFCYYDRFGNFDEQIIKKLFTWAFMIRIDMEVLSFSTINKYAIGEENDSYSNNIPMFFLITNSKKDKDLLNIGIKIKKNEKNKDWVNELYKFIEGINTI